MPNNRVLTTAEQETLEKLSIGILDLCDVSGVKDGDLITQAAISCCAAIVASKISEDVRGPDLEAAVARAGSALSREITAAVLRHRNAGGSRAALVSQKVFDHRVNSLTRTEKVKAKQLTG
ncbi:MAG: hypothetical protein H0U98_07405 [Alphaproteobacteria bacterium]|nr:hypothetical protein [Alphaproteobacteria bacterium]